METQHNQTPTTDYTMGIIAYITPIGLIVAYISNKDKKDEFVSYHIRQALGLMLTSFALGFASNFLPLFISLFLSSIIGLGMLILWVLGLVNAINKKKAPIPLLGEKYNEWFKNV